jgi:hypothetical protein
VSASSSESKALTKAKSAHKTFSKGEESDSDSDSDPELVQIDGDNGIIDALTPPAGQCEARLWIDEDELNWQMDQFSRKFDITNYNNAVFIAGKLGVPLPKVHTWALLDNAWSFRRIRRYSYVQENMDMLEHFEDNANMNISNSINIANFIKVGKTVVLNLKAKYHDGEFADPADFDPRD